jgi:hypothetical protein
VAVTDAVFNVEMSKTQRALQHFNALEKVDA